MAWSKLFRSFASLWGSKSSPVPPVQAESRPAALPRLQWGQRTGVRHPDETVPEEAADLPALRRGFDAEDESGFDEVEILGRSASYDAVAWANLQEKARVVESSNVYSFVWEWESDDTGILYVTYLNWTPGMKAADRSGPGATYSYADFSRRKYLEFAEASNESAGKAVWDYCRVRGSQHGHQHRVALVAVAGKYVPRKATAGGLKRRMLVRPGMPLSRRKLYARIAKQVHGVRSLNELADDQLPTGFQRSTLGEQAFPDRGSPDRGSPNRGRPNRGR